nr:6K2 [Callistephus mottle virus]
STQAMAQHLQLQGKWNGSLITKDILIMLATLLGGSWLLYTWFRESWNQPVYHQ